jgi:hypothetical protein
MRLSKLADLVDLAELITIETGKLTKEDIRSVCLYSKFLVDDVFREILARRRMFGEAYPFSVENSVVLTSANVSYKFCVRCAVLSGNLTGESFERLTAVLLDDFFGNGTNVLNCGTANPDKPNSFWNTITWISTSLSIPVGSQVRPSRLKDGGVDIIVWKSPPDSRSGFPIMLVQATVQQNLYSKCKDIDRRMWSSWLTMDVDPIVALSSPHLIIDKYEYQEISVNAMIIDRIRLSAYENSRKSLEVAYLCSVLDVHTKTLLDQLP